MLNYTDEAKESWLRGMQKNIKLTFSDGSVLENGDVVSESLLFEQNLCDGIGIAFGSVSSAYFRIEIREDLKRYKGLGVNVELETEGNTTKLGSFTVDQDENTDGMLTKAIICYDKIAEFGDIDLTDWYEVLPWNDSTGITMKQFRDSLFAYIGVEQANANLINDDVILNKSNGFSQLSALDAVQAVCQMNACFGIIDSEGRFRYVTLTSENDGLYPSETLLLGSDVFPVGFTGTEPEWLTPSDYRQLSFSHAYTTCKLATRLQIRNDYSDIGHIIGEDASNTYTIDGNFLASSMEDNSIERAGVRILDAIKRIGEYKPSRVTTRFRPWVELGDYVTVESPRARVSFPILMRSLSGITAAYETYEAIGEEYFSEESNSIESTIERIDGKTNSLVRELESTKSTIRDVEAGLQTQIQQTRDEISTSVMQSTRAELEAYKQEVSTQFAQNATSFEMQFSVIKQALESEIGSNANNIEEILSYIHFEDGHIILGRGDSELTLTLKNDIIVFSQNGEDVAYFANNRLYANTGDFRDAIKIGGYGFTPTPDGGLHFHKVTSLDGIDTLSLLMEGE